MLCGYPKFFACRLEIRGETGRPPGKAKNAGLEAQPERLKKERYGGMVKVDSSLRGEVH
jgi:hypothetical protein